ncbi:hypothetical protein DT065_01075 [Salicibibacter kimchii]|uniref:Uncharacterized protein n=1 Tax=Salicibibacter kimchii TaxID=2099786 RepID=A0A345BUW8_9BACI|nr:hypothetical protein DT065_01075 [Salicibibacter kimchii]
MLRLNKFWDIMMILGGIYLGVFITLVFVTPEILNDLGEGNLLFFVGSVTLMFLGFLGAYRRKTEDKKLTFKRYDKFLLKM